MIKLRYIQRSFLLMCCIAASVFSFAQILAPKTIATSGGYSSSPQPSVSFTIGETFNQTLQNGNMMLTEGMQQPIFTDCNAAPVTGNIIGNISACGIAGTTSTATYSIDNIPGATYLWTKSTTNIQIASGQGSASIQVLFSSAFISGSISVKVSNKCGSITKMISITKKSPSAPGAISGTTNVCAFVGNGSVAYTIKKVATATSYQWIVPSFAHILSYSGGGIADNDTSITVSFDNSFVAGSIDTIKVQAVSACGGSAFRALALKPLAPLTPGAISGYTDVCPYIGTATEVVYTIKKVNNATSYQWTLPAGASFGPSDINNNDTIAYLLFDPSFISSTLSVKAISGCGNSNNRTITLYKRVPGTPGAISGATNVCPFMGLDTNIYYSIRTVKYATTYTWEVPAGAIIVDHPGGAGIADTIIGVKWLGSFTTGSIKVYANANCASSSARSLSILRRTVITPGIISVTSTGTCPGRQVTYSIAPVNYATSYLWTVPSTATILSGQGTTSVTVLYSDAALSDTIRVQAVNNCSISAQRKLKVLLTPCPPVNIARNAQPLNEEVRPTDDLEIKLSPNPSTAHFVLTIASSDKINPIMIRITDINGAGMETKKNILSGQTIIIGDHYQPGIYIAEVIQGNKSRTVKMIKLK